MWRIRRFCEIALAGKQIECSKETLYELICNYGSVRDLTYIRSSRRGFLCVHRTRKVLASRAFKHSAAAKWNNLHADIRSSNSIESFRRSLKTALFRDVFATYLSSPRL
jgi:hypothetical protein